MEINKKITQTSIQFIHDTKKQIELIDKLLENYEKKVSPKTRKLLNNKINDLKKEKNVEDQLQFINQLETIIQNNKKYNEI